VILETLLMPQSFDRSCAQAGLRRRSAHRRNSYIADQNFFGRGSSRAKILHIITCLRDSNSQPNQTPKVQLRLDYGLNKLPIVTSVPMYRDALRSETNHRYFDFK
jgi:hypothetical protein